MPEKSLGRTVVVNLDNGRQASVTKMPLGRYAEFFRELRNAPEILKTLDAAPPDRILAELPSLIATSWSDLVGALAVATGLERKVLDEEVGLAEAIELVEAVIEVNGFFGVAQKGARLLARARPTPSGSSTSSPGSSSAGSASARS